MKRFWKDFETFWKYFEKICFESKLFWENLNIKINFSIGELFFFSGTNNLLSAYLEALFAASPLDDFQIVTQPDPAILDFFAHNLKQFFRRDLKNLHTNFFMYCFNIWPVNVFLYFKCIVFFTISFIKSE